MNQTPAQLRNAAARQLMTRKRWREALDVLNEAVRLDPRLADSYLNRAEVFEALGMQPQADADRRKFTELGGVVRPPESAPAPQPTRTKVRRRPPGIGMQYPVPVRPRRRRGALTQTALTLFSVVALLVAGGIGIYLAVGLIDDAANGGEDSPTGSVTQTPGGQTAAPTDQAGNTATPQPTLAPTPEALTEALQGSPLSFDSLQAAWQAKGITAAATEVNSSVTGTDTTPVSVTLSRGGDEMHLAVLFYGDPSAPYRDFDLSDQVTPIGDTTIPGGAYGWYNRNVVVIVLDQVDTIKPDAFDAFVNLS